MTTELREEGTRELERNPWTIGILLALVALLAPHSVVYYSSDSYTWHLQVMAMTWMLFIDPHSVYWMNDPLILIFGIPGAFLRLVFGYMAVRAYQGKTTKRRAIIVGIASELQEAVVFYVPILLFQLLSPYPRGYYPILLPIPVLLLLGLVIMRIWPPPEEPTTWTDSDTQGHWWESSIRNSRWRALTINRQHPSRTCQKRTTPVLANRPKNRRINTMIITSHILRSIVFPFASCLVKFIHQALFPTVLQDFNTKHSC